MRTLLRKTKTVLFHCVFMSLSLVSGVAHSAEKELTVILKDYRFVPDTLEVPAGERFKLLVKNESAGSEEFESRELKKEKIIPPGKTASLVIGPLTPGTYPFFGDFHPDTAKGKLIAK